MCDRSFSKMIRCEALILGIFDRRRHLGRLGRNKVRADSGKLRVEQFFGEAVQEARLKRVQVFGRGSCGRFGRQLGFYPLGSCQLLLGKAYSCRRRQLAPDGCQVCEPWQKIHRVLLLMLLLMLVMMWLLLMYDRQECQARILKVLLSLLLLLLLLLLLVQKMRQTHKSSVQHFRLKQESELFLFKSLSVQSSKLAPGCLAKLLSRVIPAKRDSSRKSFVHVSPTSRRCRCRRRRRQQISVGFNTIFRPLSCHSLFLISFHASNFKHISAPSPSPLPCLDVPSFFPVRKLQQKTRSWLRERVWCREMKTGRKSNNKN